MDAEVKITPKQALANIYGPKAVAHFPDNLTPDDAMHMMDVLTLPDFSEGLDIHLGASNESAVA